MNNNIIIIAWIILLAVILMRTSNKCNGIKLEEHDKSKEGFYTYYGYYKKYCPSCGWRSRYSCSKCTNCGWCVNASGYGECVPGDSSGPYFREDCTYWEYGSPYYNSNVFPVITSRSIYPYYRYRLRRPSRYNTKKSVGVPKNTSN